MEKLIENLYDLYKGYTTAIKYFKIILGLIIAFCIIMCNEAAEYLKMLFWNN